MALQSLFESLRNSLLQACHSGIVSPAQTKEISLVGRLTRVNFCLGSKTGGKMLEITFNKNSGKDAFSPGLCVHPPTTLQWTPPSGLVTMTIAGMPCDSDHEFLNGMADRLSLFTDLCHYAACCIQHFDRQNTTRSGDKGEFKITCDEATMKQLLSLHPADGAKLILASAFIATHIARVTGETNFEVGGNHWEEGASMKVGGQPWCPVRVTTFAFCDGEDSDFIGDVKSSIAQCLDKASCESPAYMYLCIMLDEIRACQWYLKARDAAAGQQKQQHRLPCHDIARICLLSNEGHLKIQVTAFDSQREKYFYQSDSASAEQILSDFRDDKLLQTLLPICETGVGNSSIFRLECFTVPCRTTLHLLQPTTEVERQVSSLTQGTPCIDKVATYDCLTQLCQAAANGNVAEAARIAETNPQCVKEQLSSLPNRSALLCAAAASVKSFAVGNSSHASCAKLLIELDVSAAGVTDSRKQNVLHLAVLSENLELARFVVEKQLVDLNALDKSKRTAMTCAVSSGNLEMVKLLFGSMRDHLLCEEGARSFSSYYWTAWKLSHQNICVFLHQKKFGQTEDEIRKAVKLCDLVCSGDAQKLTMKLTAANCNWRDWKGRSPLMWAAVGNRSFSEGDQRCLELLLSLGADRTATDMDGNTPLHLAAASGNLPVIRELIKAGGASLLAIRNYRDATPLMEAERLGCLDAALVLNNSYLQIG